MGYTHYWSFKNDRVEEKEFNKVLKDIKVIEKYFQDNDIVSENAQCSFDEFAKLDKNSVAYRGWLIGNELEEIDCISINGDSSKGLDHENFVLNKGLNEWTFCKTARKPYDLIVTIVLLTIKFNIRSAEISSDGDNDDWEHAFRLYRDIFPKRKNGFVFLKDKLKITKEVLV